MKLRALAASTAIGVATTMGGGALIAATQASPAAAQAPAAAPARPSSGLTTQVPCTVGGVSQTCTLRVTSLQVVNRTVQASGTVTNGSLVVPFSGVPVTDPPAACPILSLTLGPLHLNLLGLQVDLNQVVLNITAQPGPGQLLGNLLCAVANLLNGNGSTTALTTLINQLNGILAGL